MDREEYKKRCERGSIGAHVTWGEGEDITVAFEDFPVFLLEEVDMSRNTHGTAMKGHMYFDLKSAKAFVADMERAIAGVEELEASVANYFEKEGIKPGDMENEPERNSGKNRKTEKAL